MSQVVKCDICGRIIDVDRTGRTIRICETKRILPGIRVKEWDSADICTKCICIIKERRIEEEKKNETKD